jgi:hypothetical protein
MIYIELGATDNQDVRGVLPICAEVAAWKNFIFPILRIWTNIMSAIISAS